VGECSELLTSIILQVDMEDLVGMEVTFFQLLFVEYCI